MSGKRQQVCHFLHGLAMCRPRFVPIHSYSSTSAQVAECPDMDATM